MAGLSFDKEGWGGTMTTPHKEILATVGSSSRHLTCRPDQSLGEAEGEIDRKIVVREHHTQLES